MEIILASSSPRRAEVLRGAGIAFEVHIEPVDESRHPGETAEEIVTRLAELKARATSRVIATGRDRIILAADTLVELDGEIFGKPRDAAQAQGMLVALSGRTHRVLSGVFLLRLGDGAARSAVESTAVTLAPLEVAEIETYVATGEPLDKAGAYAIQGRAGKYISRIEGCYFNVVGLPLARVHSLLRELGWSENSQAEIKRAAQGPPE
jgi:septum formation protein